MPGRAWLGLVVAISGCALAPYPVVPCSEHVECRDAFGVGASCDADGWCEVGRLPPRCTTTLPDDLFERPLDYADRQLVGTLFDHTANGDNLRSVRLAAKQANSGGGADGTLLALVHCDYEDDDLSARAAAARAGAVWLADVVGAPVVVGPGTSEMSRQAFQELDGRDTLLIAPSSTSPDLTALDGVVSTDEDPGLYWRTAPPDTLQAAVIAADLALRDVDTVTILYADDTYGHALATRVATAHEARAGANAELVPFVDDNERDIAVATLSTAGVTELVFVSSDMLGDVKPFLNAAALSPGFDSTRFFLTDTAAEPRLFEVSDDALLLLARVRLTAPSPPTGTAFLTFQAAFAAEYDGADGTLDVWNPYAYDATWLAVYGLIWAQAREPSVHGTSIARGLRRLSEGSPVVVGPLGLPAVTDALGAGGSVDLQGASGSLDFDPVTGETAGPVDVLTVDVAARELIVVRTCQPDGSCVDAG